MGDSVRGSNNNLGHHGGGVRYLYLVLIILLLTHIGGATENQTGFVIFDMVGVMYSDNVDVLNYDNLNPDKSIQSQGHVRGWVDIVGFKNVSNISNVDFTDNVTPLIEFDVWGDGFGWNDNLDFVEVTSQNITYQSNLTTVSIDVHLKWHHSSLRTRTVNTPLGTKTIKWIEKDYYHEYLTLTDSETTPQLFSIDCNSTSVDVVIYNNSLTPKTAIIVNEIPANTICVRYSYDDETISHYVGIGEVNHTDKNVPYLDIVKCNAWGGGIGDGGNLSRMGDTVFINSSDFDISKMNISIHDPYSSHEISNVTISTVEWDGSEDSFSPSFWGFVVLISILVFGTVIQLRRVIR